jgi:hypothetical protein
LRATISPFNKKWEESFKQAIAKKEEEKRRENYIKNLMPDEIEDVKGKLKALGRCQSSFQ